MSGFTVARLAALVFALAPGITARDAWAQKFFVPIVDSVTPRDAFSPRDSVPQLLEWSWSTSDTALFERGFVPIAYGNGGGPGGAPAMGREILDEARRLGGDLVVVRYITIPKVDRCDLPQLSDKRDAMGRSQHETRCFSAPAENQVFAMVWRKEPVLARKRIYRRPLALRLWVAAGDTAILRGVMEEAARQDPTLDEGILLLAMANARDDVASWVLRSNPDKWMSFARTVWHYAAEYGRPDFMRGLLERGWTLSDTLARELLFMALRGRDIFEPKPPVDLYASDTLTAYGWGRLGVLRLMLSRGVSANDRYKPSGGLSWGDVSISPLSAAAQYGFLEAVDLLLGAGADPNATADWAGTWWPWLRVRPSTALGFALARDTHLRQRAQIVRLLVAKGADPVLRGPNGGSSAKEVGTEIARLDRQRKLPRRFQGADMDVYRLVGVER